MATYTKYDNFIENFANKLIDAFGTTDTWKAVIHSDAPNTSTDNSVSDLTQIQGVNGYNTNGDNITFNSTRSGPTITATATDVIWTASGGNLGNTTNGRYVSYHNSTAGNLLAASWDYGSTFTVASGETLTLDFGASLFTLA